MKTLIMASTLSVYDIDENGNEYARIIDNDNGFLDNLRKYMTKRKCMVIISGNPKKKRTGDPNEITRKSFAMSGIPFDEYIYVNDDNKEHIAEYIAKADCINLFGGHLPRANAFINELNLKELLKDYNGVVIGASGGAMNMADIVYCIPEVEGEHNDPTFHRYLKGLGLTNINIIPHYRLFEELKFSDGTKMLDDVLLSDSKQSPMIALPDRSFIVQQDNEIHLFGEVYLLRDGQVSKICETNQSVELCKDNTLML
jgi:dipeptidase E